ncbi:MAG TPA: hypothetical protein VNI01_04130 [Elusimicrobiota bacterium]|jgi:hypothetical protein|nr:hypothetical protein [Elusimicrobiota bacterium]
MRQRRAYRWLLFAVAAASFVYFVFFHRESAAALAVFFLSGGAWYWLEMRKMRELDAPRPK